jgi:hypothetical protein
MGAEFVTPFVYVRHMFSRKPESLLELLVPHPPTPPPPPSDSPPPSDPKSTKPRIGGVNSRPGQENEVYDLGPSYGADEAEKQRAIEEVVQLAARKARSSRGFSTPEVAAGGVVPKGRIVTDAMTDEVKNRVLREAVSYATTMDWEVTTAKPMQSHRLRPIVLLTCGFVALLLGAHSFIGRPDWIYGPDPGRVPPQRRAGHMWFAMYLTAQHVYAYADSNGGRLPQSLSELGENWPGLKYRSLGGGAFELEATVDANRPLTFQSDRNPRVLRDASVAYLREATP